MATATDRGPGYARRMTRLGPDRAEALRQQVLREQAAALAEAASTRPPVESDHDTYQDYPPPRQHERKKR